MPEKGEKVLIRVEKADDATVYVNPQQITFIESSGGSDDSGVIRFSDGSVLKTKQTRDELYDLIEEEVERPR